MSDDSQIIVEPAGRGPQQRAAAWSPVVGPEAMHFLNIVVPQASQDEVRDATVSILARAVPPAAGAGQETGLVVGYVQSGKTMSFEAVAALARDNAIQMVIVVAGISNPLLGQSRGRLRDDLRLDDPNRPRRWIEFENPQNEDPTLHAIRNALANWRDPGAPEAHKRTILITVLKNHRRLQNLTDLVRALDLEGVPVLIIDDEADQASLNTEVQQGLESTTYLRLMELRQALPHHTYLQYTATPQAPLLISIIDSLSPNFIQILTPGQDYVGGRTFFADNLPYARVIPPGDVPTRQNPLTEPPESLLEALRVFMVGVAAGLRQGENTGNRSMLVHPSFRTAQHQQFYHWVRDIFDDWQRTLDLPDNDPDKQDLIEEFRDAHADLAQTVDDLPAFEELAPSFRYAFRDTRVLEVNARGGRTPPVDWRNAYGWILVGGQAMDRGYTVEGLTVTYMPRGMGVGNADTVQQRGRFFGYKRRYLGYCRVYLEQGTLDAFQSYVDHEEHIHSQLLELQNSDGTLDEWKRAFILDRAFRPCRNSVLAFDYMHGRFADDWINPRVVLASDAVITANLATVNAFVQQYIFAEDDGDPRRTPIQRHEVRFDVPLQEAMEQLLVPIRITGTTDSQRLTGVLLQLSKALEDDPEEVCAVYRISPREHRQRRIDADGEMPQLFQGEAPVQPRERRGEIYFGDRAIRQDENVTIQSHMIDLTRDDVVVAEQVPVVAVWVPRRMARAWIAQEHQQD
jgi:hypothetical protein